MTIPGINATRSEGLCLNGCILELTGGTMRIASGVYSMGNWKGGQVRAFLLDDGHELTLVDTLFETDARLILDEIRSVGRTPSNLKRIVLSHAHRSHLGGLAALKRLSGAVIYAHDWEAGIVDG